MNDFVDYYYALRKLVAVDGNVVSLSVNDSVVFHDGSTFRDIKNIDQETLLFSIASTDKEWRASKIKMTLGNVFACLLFSFISSCISSGVFSFGRLLEFDKGWWGFMAFQTAALASFIGFSLDLGIAVYSKRYNHLLWSLRFDQMCRFGAGKLCQRNFQLSTIKVYEILQTCGERCMFGEEKREFNGLLRAAKRIDNFKEEYDFSSAFSKFAKTDKTLSISVSPFRMVLFFVLALIAEFASLLASGDFFKQHPTNVLIPIIASAFLLVPLVSSACITKLTNSEKENEFIYWVFSFAFLGGEPLYAKNTSDK